MSVRTRTVVLVTQDEAFARRIDHDLAETGWAVVQAEDAEHAAVGGAQAVVVDARAAQRGASWRLLEDLRRSPATAVLPMVAVLDDPVPADVLGALSSGAAWVARDAVHDGLQPALERALAERRRASA